MFRHFRQCTEFKVFVLMGIVYLGFIWPRLLDVLDDYMYIYFFERRLMFF